MRLKHPRKINTVKLRDIFEESAEPWERGTQLHIIHDLRPINANVKRADIHLGSVEQNLNKTFLCQTKL